MYNERSLFPMLGVGIFNIMFWVGFVVGHNIGLTCELMFLNSLLFGGLGSYGVVRLERISKGSSPGRTTKKVQPAQRVKPGFERVANCW